MERAFHVAFGLHNRDNYHIQTLVALASLLSRASRPVAVHILHDETISTAHIDLFKKLVGNFDASARFYDLSARLKELPALDSYQSVSIGTMFRLFLPQLLEDATVLYLDSDIVVTVDVVSLLSKFMDSGHPLSAVQDILADKAFYRTHLRLLGIRSAKYFNAGVLLMNCPAMNLLFDDLPALAFQISEKCPHIAFGDQDILNILFASREVGWLPAKANFQLNYKDRHMMQPEKLDGKIVHYVGRKPWNTFFPAAKLYWREREKLASLL